MKKGLHIPARVISYPLSPSGRKGGNQVTTIVGILCKDGLVIASDSQASRGPSMREEYLKIWDLKVTNKLPVLITGAGRAGFIAKYRELLQSACDTRTERQPIKTSGEFVRLAEQTMQDLAREYGTERLARLGLLQLGGDEQRGLSTSMLRMLFPDLLGIIGIHDGRPRLFFVSPDGIAEEQQSFGAEGSGGPYAEYLLPKFYYPEIPVSEAEISAIYIVEQVKHADPHSGGPTQVASITKLGIRHWTPAEIQATEAELAKIEQKSSQQWRSIVKRVGRRRKRSA